METIQKIDDGVELQMIAQGNTAEIYQYEENKIIKLFRDEMPLEPIENEYRRTTIVQAGLNNVPKAYGMISYKARYGIIYEQIRGEDMINLLMKKGVGLKNISRQLARIHADMHEKNIDVRVSVKDKLSYDISHVAELTQQEKDELLKYLEALPDGDKLCHFDYHPGNIMIQNDKPIIIDWMTACTGDACADVARTKILLNFGEMQHISFWKKTIMMSCKKKIGKIYLKEYKNITGAADEDIDQWMVVIMAARLTEWLTEHERKNLVKYIRTNLKKNRV